MNQSRVFTSFLKEILKTKSSKSLHYSSKSVIQSSVGIIFKCETPSKFTNVDYLIQNWKEIREVNVLMAQRGGYERDINAYNVVFPGGQADPGENDLEACKRELKEEVDLSVDENCIYVGKIPQNFYYARKRGRYVYISCNVWILKPQSKFQVKLNPQQLIDYRWVPLSQLIDPANLQLYDGRQLQFLKRLGWKILRQSIQENLMGVNFPSINVGLKRDLWGLTLWLVSYILQMSSENIRHGVQTEQDKILINQIQIIKQKIKGLELLFKRNYILRTPLTLATKIWHHRNRVQQFTYKKSSWMKFQTPFLVLILLLTLIVPVMVCLQ